MAYVVVVFDVSSVLLTHLVPGMGLRVLVPVSRIPHVAALGATTIALAAPDEYVTFGSALPNGPGPSPLTSVIVVGAGLGFVAVRAGRGATRDANAWLGVARIVSWATSERTARSTRPRRRVARREVVEAADDIRRGMAEPSRAGKDTCFLRARAHARDGAWVGTTIGTLIDEA